MKYLYIDLLVIDGGREHNHRLVTQTSEEDIDKFVEEYASSYWGESWEEDGVYFAHGGEIAIAVFKHKEIDEELYHTLKTLFY